MVTFYGAGERTGIMNVENKLAKVLEKQENFLVVKASERDAVMSEISARMARYEKFDPDMYRELKALRQDVKDMFNKGLAPGDDMLEQLYFLEPRTRDFVEKLSREYGKVVTPDDFQQIAMIMSENLRSQVPILKDFTKFFGRLAEDYALHAKPKAASIAPVSTLKTAIYGDYKAGKRLPKWLSRTLGIKDESIKEKILNRIPGYVPDSTVSNIIMGYKSPVDRKTGFTIGKFDIAGIDVTKGIEVGYDNKLPKSWTNIPWVNFDGKTLEQVFTQTFEEKLAYKNAEGKWINNIIQVQQKTEPTTWEQYFLNKKGTINDIVDTGKARTAYAVNGNHSKQNAVNKLY